MKLEEIMKAVKHDRAVNRLKTNFLYRE